MTTSNTEPRWLVLLRSEVEKTSIGRAALRVGYSRTAISQALSGKYNRSLDNLEAKVLAALELPMAIACPYLGLNLPTTMCNDMSGRPAPTHNPVAVNWWRACQTCEHRCEREEA